jgi:RNAse (barnase) inhibitor barstar
MTNPTTPFRFVSSTPSYNTAEVFVARLNKGIATVDELFKSLSYILWFPSYFGLNWDALFDCLRDFEWMPCRKVILVHEGLPQISNADLKIYLETLRDSILDWEADDEHSLEVVFQASDQPKVEKLLLG